eukprot:7858967-Lingulodinium_polyedra.AAC.1
MMSTSPGPAFSSGTLATRSRAATTSVMSGGGENARRNGGGCPLRLPRRRRNSLRENDGKK